MFTGIIEALGKIEAIEHHGKNKTFFISSPISDQLKIDQSLSHNGVCLTIESIKNNVHQVTAIDETLKKTDLGNWVVGNLVNLERCLPFNGRIDGHIVQGHVDTVAFCKGISDYNGSTVFSFSVDEQFASLMIEKGSIAVNGISLTLFEVSQSAFSVAIIPYTLANTNMHQIKENQTVNIEFDMMGKYINRYLQLYKQPF